MPGRLLYLVTEDWYFLSHRLPMARAAREAGFEVHVAARMAQGRVQIGAEGFTAHSVEWTRRDINPLKLAAPVLAVRSLVKQLQPAILHNIALKPALIGSLAARGLGLRGVVSSINGLGSAYLATGMAGALKRGALKTALSQLVDGPRAITIVQNEEDMAALVSLGVARARLRLVPGSGVDTTRLVPLPEPDGPVTFAYSGRLLTDKGLHALVAAFRQARASQPDLQLLLAGAPDPENPTSIGSAELAAWAREPGITLLGHVADIRKVWARAHVAVLPSRREGLPLSLLEASACGRPMIATDVPGCRQVVEHGRTGLLVPLDDFPALATAMLTLAADMPLRLRLGIEAGARAEARYSVPVIRRAVADIYRELAGGP